MLQALDSDRCISEVNIVTGTVVSSHRSLSHTYMRLRIGAQTNLRARWLLDDRATEPVQTQGSSNGSDPGRSCSVGDRVVSARNTPCESLDWPDCAGPCGQARSAYYGQSVWRNLDIAK